MGEKGTSFAWGFEGVAPNQQKKKPTPAELDQMIRTDGWALAMYGVLTWPIRRPSWHIVDAEGDKGEGELVRRQLDPLMPRIIAGMCQAVGHEIAPAELVWERGEGTEVVLKDVGFRPVDTIRVTRDKNGRVTGFKQRAFTEKGMVNEEFKVAERKAFIYAHDSTTTPGVGHSAFETAYHYYCDKQRVLFYRWKNLEKFGGPTTHGRTNSVGDRRTAFEETVRDARSGAAIVTALEDEIDVLHTPNAGTAFRQAITDINFEMAVSTLVQWLAYAQEGNSGSYNASSVQISVLDDVTQGRIYEMQDSAQELARHIVEVNFGPDGVVPDIVAENITEEPKKLTIEAARTLFTNKRPMPDWFAEALAELYARILNIEKPEGEPWFGPPELEPEEGFASNGNGVANRNGQSQNGSGGGNDRNGTTDGSRSKERRQEKRERKRGRP